MASWSLPRRRRPSAEGLSAARFALIRAYCTWPWWMSSEYDGPRCVFCGTPCVERTCLEHFDLRDAA